jgi:hypothetical protein
MVLGTLTLSLSLAILFDKLVELRKIVWSIIFSKERKTEREKESGRRGPHTAKSDFRFYLQHFISIVVSSKKFKFWENAGTE